MPTNRRAILDLFLASALGLFIELVFIRWVGSELRIFGFYKNLALIAAFLGLGIGFALHRKSQQAFWFTRYYFPLMAVISLVIIWLGRNEVLNEFVLASSNPHEYVWAQQLYIQNEQLLIVLDILFYATMLILFGLLTLLFIPLGQLTASKFDAFTSLTGYTVNVIGSLVGILTYTAIAFLSWPPPVWFLIAGGAALYFIPRNKMRDLVLSGVLAAIPILLTWLWPTHADRTLWSPYYRIDINAQYADADNDLLLGYSLNVNQSYHQVLVNLDPTFVQSHYTTAPEHFDAMEAEYDTPYAAATRLERVLVVGAGTGNDVAAALRAGAGQVVAVEIDPVIFRLGEELHPEDPYGNPRVIQITEDARTFFERDTSTYNLIVFGLLDSHTLFSAASSVRLDNFVYTQESLTQARELLTDDGLLALSFAVPAEKQWVGLRLYRTITDVFGHSPQVYALPNNVTLFLINRERTSVPAPDSPLATTLSDYTYSKDIAPVTDDWPYLYLQGRFVPTTYLIILAGVIILSLLLIRGALPSFRQINLHFFFMGSAFFLLETKSITEMALLFGSTWIVNAAVIAAILIMIVAANLLVQRLKISNPYPYYIPLAATLLLDFFVPVRTYLGMDPVWRILLAGLTQVFPLFFAAIIFAVTFSQAKAIAIALGSNLLGSVLGGIFEYSSLPLGIRSLYLFALAFYGLSALSLFMQGRRVFRESIATGNLK